MFVAHSPGNSAGAFLHLCKKRLATKSHALRVKSIETKWKCDRYKLIVRGDAGAMMIRSYSSSIRADEITKSAVERLQAVGML